jgi:spermidine/putrescine transport system ATP-binding protein
LQVGTPQEIYSQPVDYFVAGFVGESNFLDAEFLGETDGKAQLRLASGAMLSTAAPGNAIPPGSVKLCIRPEHAEVVSDPNRSQLKGLLENIIYFGTDTHYHVRLENKELFVIREQNPPGGREALKPGDQLGIAIRKNAVQILKG